MSSLLSGNSHKDNQHFSRRAFVVGAAQGGILALLGARLGWLQLAEGQHYTMLSDKNRIDMKILAPARGEILDRHGNPLAVNMQNFRVLLTPEQAPSPEAALNKLKDLITLEPTTITQTLNNIKRVAKFTSVEIRDQLTWDDLSKIEAHINDLPGISTDVGTLRTYPLNEASAHITGYVGAPTQDDLRKDRIYGLPGFKIGKTGIERHRNAALEGRSGLSHVEVNVTGREVYELARTPATTGRTLNLTLDKDLQLYVQQRLSKTVSGSATVMDCHTGAIYAMASHPAFDPNLFVQGMSERTWKTLLSTRGHPLTNKAVAGLYPPASTFKMVTALAALKARLISPETEIYCNGHYDYKGQRFHCWKQSGHKFVNLAEALSQSCDTFFYKIAAELGIDAISKTARTLGLGEDFSTILSESRSGLVPDKNWKMGHVGQPWKPGDTILSSIGQGALQATPLQLAVMTARLVNGGRAVEPSLLLNPNVQGKRWKKLPFKHRHLQDVKAGMRAAVNHKKGTAFNARIQEAAMAMGGKTGTAQVKRITASMRAAGIKNEDLPWKQRHHALFVGYAPLHNPRYVCSVVIEHGVSGSSSAAPIAKDILKQAQTLSPHTRTHTKKDR